MSEYYSDPTQNPRSREYKGPRASLKDLFPYLKPHRTALGFALGLSVLGSALALAQPLLIGQLITAVEQSLGFGNLAIAIVALVITS
ncbi:MAG: ABC transporter ATP-binding protein, partial [Aquiluna sp.]